MNLITKQDAQSLGLKIYVVETSCKNGHQPCNRYVTGGNCVDCVKTRSKTPSARLQQKLYRELPSTKEASKTWFIKKKSDLQWVQDQKINHAKNYRIRIQDRDYVDKLNEQSRVAYSHPEVARKKNEQVYKRYHSNPLIKIRKNETESIRKTNPEVRKRINERGRLYAKNNPHLMAANTAKRRAYRRDRSGKWGDEDEIKRVYKRCAELRTLHPELDYQVDHIVPLKGIDVSGLHVWWNLSITPGKLNRQKANKFTEQDEKEFGIWKNAKFYRGE